MRKIFLAMAVVLLMSSSIWAATLNLKATWDPNTETDMISYRFYRTDGMRMLIGTIPHPTASYNFSVTVPDNSLGILSFVVTAVNPGGESGDSNIAYFAYDYRPPPPPPIPPSGLKIVTDKSSYTLGQTALITMNVLDTVGKPITNAHCVVTIKRPDGTTAGGMTPYTNMAGIAKVQFRVFQIGNYTVNVAVNKGTVVYGKATTTFIGMP